MNGSSFRAPAPPVAHVNSPLLSGQTTSTGQPTFTAQSAGTAHVYPPPPPTASSSSSSSSGRWKPTPETTDFELMDVYINPVYPPQGQRDPMDPWLEDGRQATDWVGRFYDLLIGSILQIFGQFHALKNAEAVGPYTTFYLIVHWIWLSQVHYDVRYEGEDLFHRILKGLQLLAVSYLGAAGSGWNLSLMRGSGGAYVGGDHEPSLKEKVTADLAKESFVLVSIAVLAHTISLLLVYFRAFWSVKKKPDDATWRWETLGPLVRHFFSRSWDAFCAFWTTSPLNTSRPEAREILMWRTMFLSAAMLGANVAVAATQDPHSAGFAMTKRGLFFGAISLQILAYIWSLFKFSLANDEFDRLVERYSALTYIILGEGLMGAIGALAQGQVLQNQKSKTTLAIAGLALGVTYILWALLFHTFKSSRVSQLSGWWRAAWEGVHIPLHLSIILMFAAISNILIAICVFHAQREVDWVWDQVLEKQVTQGTSLLEEKYVEWFAYIVDRIDPEEMDFRAMWADIQHGMDENNKTNALLGGNSLNGTVTVWDPELQLEQYRMKGHLAVSDMYGLEYETQLFTTIASSDNETLTYDKFMSLSIKRDFNVNSTQSSKNVLELDKSRYDEIWRLAMDYGSDLYRGFIDQTSIGVWWLFLASGLTLICCAIRSWIQALQILRRRHQARYHLTYILRAAAGVLLALLVLFKTKKHYDYKLWNQWRVIPPNRANLFPEPFVFITTKLTDLSRDGISILIVFIFYIFVITVPMVVLLFWRKCLGRTAWKMPPSPQPGNAAVLRP